MKDFENLLRQKLQKCISRVLGDIAEDGTHWPGVYVSSDTIYYATEAALCVILGAVSSQDEAEAEGIIKRV